MNSTKISNLAMQQRGLLGIPDRNVYDFAPDRTALSDEDFLDKYGIKKDHSERTTIVATPQGQLLFVDMNFAKVKVARLTEALAKATWNTDGTLN